MVKVANLVVECSMPYKQNVVYIYIYFFIFFIFFILLVMQGMNPRKPLVCKASALPSELHCEIMCELPHVNSLYYCTLKRVYVDTLFIQWN